MKLKRLWCRHQLNEKIQDNAIYTSKNYKNGTEFKMAQVKTLKCLECGKLYQKKYGNEVFIGETI